MISIVISEKGGAERRARYDHDEIGIGRVKGNDVMLPKGNVSKRHARLICRDGRYIVTDLKSTNGTYVNHRRITHATLVREGDRIYIGDFVLRIDDGQRALNAGDVRSSSPDLAASTTGSHPSTGRHGPASARSIPPPDGAGPPREEVVSHFPIEHDPDESSPGVDVPAPPRLPTGLRQAGGSHQPASVTDGPVAIDAGTPGASAPAISSDRLGLARSSRPGTDRAQVEARQRCFEALMSAIEQELDDLDALDGSRPLNDAETSRVEAAVDTHVKGLVERGQTADLDEAVLRQSARAELVDLGPVGPLLDDESVTRIEVLLRQLRVVRRGQKSVPVGLGFSSEDAVARLVRRLCARTQSDASPNETVFERTLQDGRELFVVRPPASPNGHLVTIAMEQRADSSLNALVRSGTISRGMATLLAHCVAARANVLVVGTADAGASELCEALADAVPGDQRTLWLCDGPTARRAEASLMLSGADDERAATVAAALRLGVDRLMAPPLGRRSLIALLDGITRGREGIVLHATAQTLRQAWSRIAADVAGERTGLTPETAREWLGAAFDVGLEVTRLRDGRARVVRLSEFRSGSQGTILRDVFTFAYHRTAAGGAIEGSFYASGTVPRLVEDLAARGMPLDTSIFRRHPSG